MIDLVAAERGHLAPAVPTIPTTEQLAWAARVAWANADKGIGRLRWRGLHVRDLRGVTDPDAVASGLAEHLRVATRDGRIRSVATVLDPSIEILNGQLVSYAGYRQADGSILGDPHHLELTTLALRAGWPGGRPVDGGRLLPGPFDVLPLLLRVHGGPVIAYELSPERVLEVPLEHPAFAWFAALGLRWYAVPALSRHRLHFTEALAYPVAFSGFYVAFEMACRELADPNRYNVLPMIARCLGREGHPVDGPWLREAARVLQQSILHSFGRAGMVPPTASARLEIYHRYMPRPKSGPRPMYRPIDAPVPSGVTAVPAGLGPARHRLERAAG
ncbi:nitric oxide synthase oxygenase [Cryptosporangium sp. NPDC051539]|uniref:nitric oxide synthase oxygenase n=1 Tax=Cryptosporangium sp. NPDC051539 TaxID=3363962 RepID=UPI0037A6CE48